MSKFWNITPFDYKKRLGKIHNDFIELIPDNDYVIVTDPDMMFLLPNQLNWIEDIVLSNPAIDVFGCMTNRIGVDTQLHSARESNYLKNGDKTDPTQGDVISTTFENPNVKYHIGLASDVFKHYGYSIQETDLVAGFLMVFRKSLWNKIKFQEGINFDIKFCEAVKNQGGRIAIMKGVYVFHQYRMFANDPKYKKHLLNK